MLLSAGYERRTDTGRRIRMVRGNFAVSANFDEKDWLGENTGLFLIRYNGNAIHDKLMSTKRTDGFYLYDDVPEEKFMSIATGKESRIEPRIQNELTKRALEDLE